MSSSMFADDPIESAATQQLASAQESAEVTGDALLDSKSDLYYDSDEPEVEEPPKKPAKAQQPNFKDESAFPSLNGGSSAARPTSIWNSSSRAAVAPVRSQVVPSSDLVTETIKLEASQQQSRSLGANHGIGETVKSVQRSTGTTIQTSIASKSGTATFLIRGKSAAVAAAKAALYKDLAKRVSLKMQIPSAVRPFIIGTKGKTLKDIEAKTGARVQLPKRDDESANEEMSEITIEADAFGANEARKEIEAIVAARTSSATIKITSVPSDHYPFISLRTQAWESEHEDLKIKVPTPSLNESVPVAITVSGEKNAVADIKTQIEALSEELARTTIASNIQIPKVQHQFIGPAITDILRRTGCSIVVPPPSSSSELITVRGPAANLGSGITLAMEQANSMSFDSLEISRAHGGNLEHAINLATFFAHSSSLSGIEQQHKVKTTLPADLTTADKVIVQITGKGADGVKAARQALIALVNTLPPAKFARVDIEPLLHKSVIGSKQKNVSAIKKQTGVDVIFGSDEKVVLVIEKAADQNAAKAALEEATILLNQHVADAGQISSSTISISAAEHKFVQGKNNTTLNVITGGSESVVRVTFGEPSADEITVRGPEKEVNRVIKAMGEVVTEAKDAETAAAFKLEFDFPQQYTKNLIGKGGQNISKLREELGVKIEVGDDGKIQIQGPQRNAEEARSRITAMGERLVDETTFNLKIPAEFHGQIIGQGGKLVKRLEEKYNVNIQFPRGESGGNEVIVKGGKKGATKARDEIMELFQYESEHSYSVTIQVLQRAVSHIVGRGGAAITELKDETNTRIDIDRSTGNESDLISVVITGRKSQVETAKAKIEEINREVQDTVTRTVIVDPAHHRNLIGAGGANLRSMVVKAGGPGDASARAHMVRFPRPDDTSNEITLRGPAKVVEKIAKAIEKIVGDAASQHSDTVDIPNDQVPLVIGRGGSKKQELEKTHSVTIDIPRTSPDRTADVTVKILGTPENIEKAKADIQSLIKVTQNETISVPRRLHAAVADGGAFIRRLRSDFKVQVSHNGEKVPTLASGSSQPPPPQQQSAARIDDDDQQDDSETAFVLVASATSDEAGEIPWVLRGEQANIERAKRAIATALAQAEQQTHTAYMTVPSSKHRFVIGAGGAKINEIRKATGTSINVPRGQSDDTIVMKGSKEGLEQARDLILDAIRR